MSEHSTPLSRPEPHTRIGLERHVPVETPRFRVLDGCLTRPDEYELEEQEQELELGSGAAEAAETAEEVAKLEERLAAQAQELQTLREHAQQQVTREVALVRRRFDREAEQRRRSEKMALADPMLDVFEALLRSVEAAREETGADGLRDGIERVCQLMERKLGELGLDRVAALGECFDPNKHEAVMIADVDDAEDDGIVLRELSPGFSIDGQVVRPPKVQVGRRVVS